MARGKHVRNRIPNFFTYGAVAVFTILFLHLLTSYWSFFQMGSAGGNGMALLFLALPLSLVLFGITGVLADRVARRSGWKPGVRRAVTVMALFCTFALLFWGETVRTKDYPQENGEPAQVSDFLRSYIARR
jgi:MFS family permease